MRIRIVALLAVIAAFMAVATPAQAIIDGVPDEGAHPYVGEVVLYVPSEDDPRFDDPGFWSTCTGTLVSPTVVVTAGHCAFDVGHKGQDGSDTGETTSGSVSPRSQTSTFSRPARNSLPMTMRAATRPGHRR